MRYFCAKTWWQTTGLIRFAYLPKIWSGKRALLEVICDTSPIQYLYQLVLLWVAFRKDILTEEYLRALGLNERQIKAECKGVIR